MTGQVEVPVRERLVLESDLPMPTSPAIFETSE
jgi:hypothetical protein